MNETEHMDRGILKRLGLPVQLQFLLPKAGDVIKIWLPGVDEKLGVCGIFSQDHFGGCQSRTFRVSEMDFGHGEKGVAEDLEVRSRGRREEITRRSSILVDCSSCGKSHQLSLDNSSGYLGNIDPAQISWRCLSDIEGEEYMDAIAKANGDLRSSG